jgi:hypothetical protein
MRSRSALISLVLAFFVVAGWPAQALAKAIGRFIHAVPGAGAAKLTFTGAGAPSPLGKASFGEASPYAPLPTGPITWRLTGADSGKLLASGHARLSFGAYTVIAIPHRKGVELRFFRNAAGAKDGARVRLIHAAPELGSPDLRLGNRVVARGVRFTQATPYLHVAPGTYSLAATPPGSASRVVFRDGVRLERGTATTGVVLGTAGQKARILVLPDVDLRADKPSRPAAEPSRPARRAKPRRAARRRQRAAAQSAGAHSGGGVTVHRGDSLWSIARRHLGSSATNASIDREVHRLWAANSRRIGTGDPNLIFPGQHLNMN